MKVPYTLAAQGSKDQGRKKMAFIECAICGILLHDNLVQTYQADIRPVFLEDGTAMAAVGKSDWTGLGEGLSNDTISQQTQESMRIHEWELMLIMEYCDQGVNSPAFKLTCLNMRSTCLNTFITVAKWHWLSDSCEGPDII